MSVTRQQGAERALSVETYPSGQCYKFTRQMFGRPAVGDVDGDGDADAVDGWLRATGKHPGDRNPPRGVPAFWAGGRKGYGHAAVSLGDGKIRSTDVPVAGKVGTVDLGWVERNWGLRYLGWAEGLNGVPIPNPGPPRQIDIPEPSRGRQVDKAVRATRKARRRARRRRGEDSVRFKRLSKALEWLRKIKEK